ncbi:DNA-binding transcriptional regulator, MarR family [Pedococcus dokdonensis]|uniref:DNA-binding transcriptional regulator, MarR family n=1 Tax=Pedococcus dokdonensis TaxID=443156 RepID=A0A1H0SHD6_9MICO|nr:MarR family winged helix-turn-helix transcriptional regulator [Pedococcus dokdonensis]SDP41117.1 DNA-binding transcriptional regulator, MarR family [Pedococcus dokdonensis]
MPQPLDRSDLDDLVTALLTASRVLVGVSARSLAEVQDDVTVTQFRLLVVLRGHGETRLNRLADRLGVTPSTALRSVDRLIASDLVTRRENTQDRREVVIELTPRGRRVVDHVTERRREAIRVIVEAMPREQARRLVEALSTFAEAADEPTAALDAANALGW